MCRSRSALAAVLGLLVAASATPAAAGAADSVYWGNVGTNTISSANAGFGGGGAQLDTTGATMSAPFGLAIDSAAGRIYWANFTNNTISYASLSGGGGGQLDTTGATVSNPVGLAIDSAAGRIYWANGGNHTISSASLSGGGGAQLDTTGATVFHPVGLAIDSTAGRIYWANNGSISSASLSGGGGAQLDTTGATVSHPNGLAIDSTAGRIYWTNNGTISSASLSGGGGAQLDTGSEPVQDPVGVAIDSTAGRIYWTNNGSISSASLSGGSGAQHNTTGATVSFPWFLALLKTPSGTGKPSISGDPTVGSTLSCSQGDWAADQNGAQLYRAPRSYAYQWTLAGADIPTATSSSYVPPAPGSYACRVAATNQAGSASQTSDAATVLVTSSTSLTCTPDSRQIGQGSTCTAALTGSSPTGTVNFTEEGPGDLGAASCTLALDGTCSVTYTPSGRGDGTHTVTADYQGDATHSTSFGTDDVTYANTPPSITAGAASDAPENQTAVTTVTSTDPDSDTPSYAIDGGADAAKFSIDSSSGALSFTSAPDFEAPTDTGQDNVYDVDVKASDGNGGADTKAIAVTVTNVSEAGPPQGTPPPRSEILKCAHLRAKLQRQERGLKKAKAAKKRSHIKSRIANTEARLRQLGCA